MFDISFVELLVIAIVGLLVIGPDRLPEALRTLGLWVGRMRRSFTNVKNEIEKEIGMDEIRRQLHNEAVMEEMKRIERDVRNSVNTTAAGNRPAGTEPSSAKGASAAPADYSPEPHPRTGELTPPAAHGEQGPEPPAENEEDSPPSSPSAEPDRPRAAGNGNEQRHG